MMPLPDDQRKSQDRAEPITIVAVAVHTSTCDRMFAAAFVASGVPEILREMDAWAAEEGFTVNGAKNWSMDRIESDPPPQDDADGEWLAETLLWVACRDHAEHNAATAQAASLGGYTVFLNATCYPDDRMVWALVVGLSEGHPMAGEITAAMATLVRH